jgi:hypothetical protein
MGISDPKQVEELVSLLRQSSMFHSCSKETLTKVCPIHASTCLPVSIFLREPQPLRQSSTRRSRIYLWILVSDGGIDTQLIVMIF